MYFQTYSVEWKRKAFFKFVDVFHDQTNWPQELKAKVIYVFKVCMPLVFQQDQAGAESAVGEGRPIVICCLFSSDTLHTILLNKFSHRALTYLIAK